MREILERLLSGEISTKEAEKLLQISTMKQIEDVALDIRREIRTGIPEVVWSEDKTSAKVVEIVRQAPHRLCAPEGSPLSQSAERRLR